MSRAISPPKTATPSRRGANTIVLISVIVPPLALLTVMILAWGQGFGVVDLSLFFGMYLVCGLGITVGFHRYFTHKSFMKPKGRSTCSRKDILDQTISNAEVLAFEKYERNVTLNGICFYCDVA